MIEEAFANRAGAKQVESESNEIYILEKVEADPTKGIFTYIQDAQFPLKGFPSSDAIFAINQIKKIVVETVKILGKWYLLPLCVGLLLQKQNIIEAFNKIAWKVISPYVLKFHYMTKFSQTLHGIVLVFLMEMGITEEAAERFATIFVHLIEYDGAYRYRMIDLFSETSKERIIKDPRKEIKRIAALSQERDEQIVAYKFDKAANILSYLLLVPSIKRAFKKSIEQSNFKDLQYDDIDLYWSLCRTDYRFMGMGYKDRLKYAEGFGWSYPKPQDKTKL